MASTTAAGAVEAVGVGEVLLLPPPPPPPKAATGATGVSVTEELALALAAASLGDEAAEECGEEATISLAADDDSSAAETECLEEAMAAAAARFSSCSE